MNPQPMVKANPGAGAGFDISSIWQSISSTNPGELVIALLLSGISAIFLAELYKRFSHTVSNHDSFARLFPMITITTTVVIFVVKSSLALSLGLVGALSIVRFRAAIKEPEELMYLFMCIAMGLTFGANMPFIAMLGLLFFVFFIVAYQVKFHKKKRHHSILLSIIAESELFFQENWQSIHTILAEECERYSVQRVEMDNEQFQLNANIRLTDLDGVFSMLSRFQKLRCQVSYVNLDDLL